MQQAVAKKVNDKKLQKKKMPSLEFIFKLCSNASITARTDSDEQNTNDKKNGRQGNSKTEALILVYTFGIYYLTFSAVFSLK